MSIVQQRDYIISQPIVSKLFVVHLSQQFDTQKWTFLHTIGHSNSDVISLISILTQKLLSLPWDSHGNSILMGLLIPMSLVPFPFHSSQRDIPIPIVAKKLLSFPWDSLREFHSNETFHSHVISPIPIPIVAKAISILTGPISIENPVPTHTHCETSDVSLPFQPHDITALRPVPKSTA